MANMPGIVIKVTSQVTDAVRGLNKVNTALGKTTTAGQKWGAGMKIAGAAAAAGAAVAAAAIVDYGADAVKAFAEDEKSVAAFDKTLENLGLATHTREMHDYIDALQLSANVSDADLRPALASLLTVTKDVTQAQKLLALSVDLAAAKQIPLETAANAVAKAASGQLTALRKLVPGVRNLAELSETVTGSAARQAETLSGSLAGIQEQWGELQESVGEGLVVGGGAKNGALTGIEQQLHDLGPLGQGVGYAIGSTFSFITKPAQLAGLAISGVTEALTGADKKLRDTANAAWSAADAYSGAAAAAQAFADASTDPRYMTHAKGEMYRYAHYQQGRADKLAARRKRIAAKKASRAEAVADARKAEIAKRRAEARTGNKFGAIKTPGHVSC